MARRREARKEGRTVLEKRRRKQEKKAEQVAERRRHDAVTRA